MVSLLTPIKHPCCDCLGVCVYNSINGIFCGKLHRYVEHNADRPCETNNN